MRFHCRFICAVTVFLSALSVVSPLRAQEVPTAKIAIVDIQYIEQNAVAAKAVRDQLMAVRNEFRTELSAKEQLLNEQRRKLESERTLIAAEVFRERRQAVEQDIADFQRLVQSRNRALDQALNEAMAQFRGRLAQVISEIAASRAANLVLRHSQTVMASGELDITADVLAAIDGVLPSLAVTVPRD